MLGIGKTCYDKGGGLVCVSQPSAISDKRFFFIQVILRQIDEQPDAAIIFRGSGEIIKADETAAYAEGVKIYW